MAIIGGVIVYYAPGNNVRVEALADVGTETLVANYGIVHTALKYARGLLYEGVFRFLAILFAFLFVISHIPPIKKYVSLYVGLFGNFVRSCTTTFRIILIVAYPAIVVAGVLPAVYVLGGSVGPWRLHATVYFFLIASFGMFYSSLRATAKSIGGRFFRYPHVFPRVKW